MLRRELLALRRAAYELGRDGVLDDPTDVEIALAARELAGIDGDPRNRLAAHLAAEYDRGHAEYLNA